jgi:hypothetical protein
MSDAPFSFALLQGVALRHLVHILTLVGDVARRSRGQVIDLLF